MRPLRTGLLAALLPFGACAVGPEVIAVEFERVGHVETVQEPDLRFEGTALVVRGMFLTRCEPFTAAARADVTPGAMRIVIRRQPADCPQLVQGNFAWRAAVRNLPAGRYEVRSVHEYGDGWAPDSATIGSAVVP